MTKAPRRGDGGDCFRTARAAAVDRIEAIVNKHNISCDFRRLDAFLFPAMGMEIQRMRESNRTRNTRRSAQTRVEVEKASGVPLEGVRGCAGPALSAQATFHPLKYINGLIAAIEATGWQTLCRTVRSWRSRNTTTA